ncbi:MAG: sugar transferase [Acidimicrobiales bacterium]
MVDRVLAAYAGAAVPLVGDSRPEAGRRPRGPAGSRLKRAMDIVGSVAGLAGLAPVMAVVAVLVRLRLGAPVLFRQVRPGRGAEPFTLVKFRTMRSGPGSDEERLTRLGRWLRATSIDELPELVNVLRGEMSLVGPRPLLVEYLERYTPEQARRHLVRPGMTGWAQVHGRNSDTWDDRLARDVWYLDHWSLGLDVRILVDTIHQVLRQTGITEVGHATRAPFLGGGK